MKFKVLGMVAAVVGGVCGLTHTLLESKHQDELIKEKINKALEERDEEES